MPLQENANQPIRDLNDLRSRKKEIRRQLSELNGEMQQQFRSLLPNRTETSPTRRVTTLLSQAGTSIDMALLGWKLYKRLYTPKKKGKKKTAKRRWLPFGK